MRLKKLIIFCIAVALGTSLNAQRGNGKGKHRHGHGHPHKRVVVKRSVYRPAKVAVFYPRWRPNYGYHRRWVFFPRHNFYWDNWRNHYVFWNGAIWISQATAPPALVNINLEKEKHRELPEEADDVDDVYQSNPSHKK